MPKTSFGGIIIKPSAKRMLRMMAFIGMIGAVTYQFRDPLEKKYKNYKHQIAEKKRIDSLVNAELGFNRTGDTTSYPIKHYHINDKGFEVVTISEDLNNRNGSIEYRKNDEVVKADFIINGRSLRPEDIPFLKSYADYTKPRFLEYREVDPVDVSLFENIHITGYKNKKPPLYKEVVMGVIKSKEVFYDDDGPVICRQFTMNKDYKTGKNNVLLNEDLSKRFYQFNGVGLTKYHNPIINNYLMFLIRHPDNQTIPAPPEPITDTINRVQTKEEFADSVVHVTDPLKKSHDSTAEQKKLRF